MNLPVSGLLYRHNTLVVITCLIEECARNANCLATPNAAIEFFSRCNDDILAQHGLVAVYRHCLLEFSERKWLSGWVPQWFHTVLRTSGFRMAKARMIFEPGSESMG